MSWNLTITACLSAANISSAVPARVDTRGRIMGPLALDQAPRNFDVACYGTICRAHRWTPAFDPRLENPSDALVEFRTAPGKL